MRRFQTSPSGSPLRKRQRMSILSSPTYDDLLPDLSQEDLAAFDEIEAKLSQPSSRSLPQGTGSEPKDSRPKDTVEAPSGSTNRQGQTSSDDDADNPFATSAPSHLRGFSSAASLPVTGFISGFAAASQLESLQDGHTPSSSPQSPRDVDYDSWFNPMPAIPMATFQSATFATASSLDIADTSALNIGFKKASDKEWIKPSSVALEKAKEKMNDIWAKSPSETESRCPSRLTSPDRPALRPVENSFSSPATPSPASGFSRPSLGANTLSSPTIDQLKGKSKAKPFKSPLLAQETSRTTTPNTPLLTTNRPAFLKAGSQHPLAAAPITAATMTPLPRAATSSASTPIRAFGIASRIGRNTPSQFITPFKPGMKPGEPGRSILEEEEKRKQVIATPSTTTVTNWLTTERSGRETQHTGVFLLTKPVSRQTLASSGLVPQRYTTDELEAMGIDMPGLVQITPTIALYYSFHTEFPIPSPPGYFPPSPVRYMGAPQGLDELLDRGCSLATKHWVDNHWGLILWKLAGMVCLDPESENDPKSKRWCWAEVFRQMLYRYERELNCGIRPPLRLITTHDAPASCPMVLCVSNIIWSKGGIGEDGHPIHPHPELEITDGWYKLRAQVDQPMARAVRRGIIRVGRKLEVAGASLSSERKEPAEILEAYTSMKLVLCGNSSHLAPWDAKLGFVMRPWVATMNSLTPDGGTVPAMDVVVLKMYPIAFIEFLEAENGEKYREGPRNEREEAVVAEQWKRRREVYESRLREKLEKKEMRYRSYIDRLERRAGAGFKPDDDEGCPDNTEDLYDELEDPGEATRVLTSVSSQQAGWLARFIGERLDKDRDRATEEIERELMHLCPPRNVRSFRVLIIQDARSRRKPANRKAQLTVWDVVNLFLSEDGSAGSFELNRRYLVTNVFPTQQTAWMDCEPGSEIYMSTRRDTKWRKMPQT